jgi:transposase
MKTEKYENKKSTRVYKKLILRTRAFKREALQELFDEEITVKDFLKKHDIGSSTLYHWKQQIKVEGPDPLMSRIILPIELKKKVAREIVSGKLSIEEAKKLYNIQNTYTLKAWCSKYSCELEGPQPAEMEKNKPPHQLPDDSDRIKELEKALEEAKLKIVGLQTMIDVAEKELKIDIRKKPGTKQSK